MDTMPTFTPISRMPATGRKRFGSAERLKSRTSVLVSANPEKLQPKPMPRKMEKKLSVSV